MTENTKSKILSKLKADGPMTVEALARQLQRPVPTMRRNCGELARQGLVSRAPTVARAAVWTVAAKNEEDDQEIQLPEPREDIPQ